jgi:hypothetical protein
MEEEDLKKVIFTDKKDKIIQENSKKFKGKNIP